MIIKAYYDGGRAYPSILFLILKRWAFFRGVAIEKADGKPQAVTVWKRLRDGEEVGAEFYTVKELKEEAKR